MDPKTKEELKDKVSFNPSGYSKIHTLFPLRAYIEETAERMLPRRAFFKWFWLYSGGGIQTPNKGLLSAVPPATGNAMNHRFQSLPDVWLQEKRGEGYYVGLTTVNMKVEK